MKMNLRINLKKRLFFAAFASLLSVQIWADEGYAVFDSETGTLTFTYETPTGTPNVDYYTIESQPWYYPSWVSQQNNIKSVVFEESFANANILSCRDWFAGCKNLTSITGIEYLKTQNVTNMSWMFYGCEKLTSLDVSYFDTSKVTNMYAMFSNCNNLTSLDVSGFDTSNVTNMATMFAMCKNLTSLDVSGFDTSNVTDMVSMFFGCEKLTSLDVSHFDTSKVTDTQAMFAYCSNLTSLDVSGFDTGEVERMNHMFYLCENLTSLSFGKKFNTSSTISNDSSDFNDALEDMFSYCYKLRYIDFSASDHSDAITTVDRSLAMFAETPRTTVIYLPHGSQNVTDVENVVYSYGGNENDLRCPNYYSIDRVDIEFPYDFKTNRAEYTREMSNNYGTVVLPYDFTSNDDIQAFTLSDSKADGNVLVFKDTNTVTAHTPFAFERKGNAQFIMEDESGDFGITIKATRDTQLHEDGPYTADTGLAGWTARGYYITQDIDDYNDMYYVAGDKFYRATDKLTTYDHRAAFYCPGGGAKAFTIETASDGNVETAIEAAAMEKTIREAEGCYDMQGRRINAPRKGVNIVRMGNGETKKVIMK